MKELIKLANDINKWIDGRGYEVIVDGKKTKEITDVKYGYGLFKPNKEDLIAFPNDEEIIERNHIIKRSEDMAEMFELDIHCRRACFANDYDKMDNHCISYFHFHIRHWVLNMFVYVRSQNFDTNFICDNQTFNLAYHSLYKKLTKKYPNLVKGRIKVFNFSLHKYI